MVIEVDSDFTSAGRLPRNHLKPKRLRRVLHIYPCCPFIAKHPPLLLVLLLFTIVSPPPLSRFPLPLQSRRLPSAAWTRRSSTDIDRSRGAAITPGRSSTSAARHGRRGSTRSGDVFRRAESTLTQRYQAKRPVRRRGGLLTRRPRARGGAA